MVELFDHLSGRPVLHILVQYLIRFYSLPEAASNVISFGWFVWPIVLDLDKCVKFCGPSLSHSREIPLQAVIGGIFDSFSL